MTSQPSPIQDRQNWKTGVENCIRRQQFNVQQRERNTLEITTFLIKDVWIPTSILEQAKLCRPLQILLLLICLAVYLWVLVGIYPEKSDSLAEHPWLFIFFSYKYSRKFFIILIDIYVTKQNMESALPRNMFLSVSKSQVYNPPCNTTICRFYEEIRKSLG